MRVLIINRISDRPEVGLYSGLKATGTDLELILDPDDPAKGAMTSLEIPVHSWRIKHRFDLSFDAKLRKLLAQKSFECIYAPTSRGVAAVLRVLKDRTTRLVTYRGTLGNLNRFNPLNLLGHLNSRVDAIVCNCQAVKSFLLSQNLPDSKLPVVFKGHEPLWYQSTTKQNRSDFGLPPDAFVVGCITNVRPLKGVQYLAQAAIELSEQIPIRLLIVGSVSDPKLVKFIEQKDQKGIIQLLGFRNDIPELLGLCDLTVLPSVRREGFPRAIVESFSNRIPVICTAVGGMPELVIDGENGLVIPPADAKALAQAMKRMYLEPNFRRVCGQQGYATVLNKLAVVDYVSNMSRVFNTQRT